MYPLFQELSFATRRMISALNTLLKPYGITYSQWVFIVYLSHHEKTSLVPIARYYLIEKPAITMIKNMFLQRHWIQEETGRDRREKIVSLTAEGKKYFHEINELIRIKETEFFGSLAPSERTVLLNLLFRLNEKEESR